MVVGRLLVPPCAHECMCQSNSHAWIEERKIAGMWPNMWASMMLSRYFSALTIIHSDYKAPCALDLKFFLMLTGTPKFLMGDPGFVFLVCFL